MHADAIPSMRERTPAAIAGDRVTQLAVTEGVGITNKNCAWRYPMVTTPDPPYGDVVKERGQDAEG